MIYIFITRQKLRLGREQGIIGIHQDSGVHYKGGQNCINIALSLTGLWKKKWFSSPIFHSPAQVKWSIGLIYDKQTNSKRHVETWRQRCQREPGERRMVQIPEVRYEDEDSLVSHPSEIMECITVCAPWTPNWSNVNGKQHIEYFFVLSLRLVVQLSDVVIRFSVLN